MKKLDIWWSRGLGHSREEGMMKAWNVFIIALSALVALAFLCIPHASHAEADYPPPPYLNLHGHYVVVGITLDAAVVRSMLPDGVEPVDELTGGINMYITTAGYGLAPYTASYIWVDVKDMNAADGSKARWLLRGFYGPEAKVPTALQKVYGLSVVLGQTHIQEQDGKVRAVGRLAGRDVMSVVIAPKRQECSPVAGTLNYPGKPAGSSGIYINEIPWGGEWCPAELVSVEINAAEGDPLNQLKPVSVMWAGELRDGNASFSRPVPAR